MHKNRPSRDDTPVHRLEALEPRKLLAVTASFDPDAGLLTVSGDNFDNNIEISRELDGEILVNDGEVFIQGGTPTVNNTNFISMFGFDGNDSMTLNEFNGALPNAFMLGGEGNDVLIGGAGTDFISGEAGNDFIRGGNNEDVLAGDAGNDVILGDRGNDQLEGGDGADLFVWNNGDASDLIFGGAGSDVVQVNGADGAGDDFSIDPNGDDVRFQRNNLGLFTLDIKGDVENLDVNGQGGSDVIIGSVGLLGLIDLDLDGGEGNDLLIGGDGVDTLRGGAGNDTLIGGKANDVMLGEMGDDLFVWNNGDGSDFMEGGDDNDTVQVNGADGAGDDFSIDPNGDRTRFQRNNLGLFVLDIGTVEDLDVNGQGGDDTIVGSVGLSGLIELDLDGGQGNDLLIGGDGIDTLRGGAGNDALIGSKGNDVVLGQDGNDLFVWNNGDGSDLLEGGDGHDIAQVNGADGAGDDFSIDPNGNRVRLQRNNLGLFTLDIGTTEELDVNGQGGGDLIAGSVGLLGLITLDFDGGEGNDLLIGGDGIDVLRGGAGNDTLLGGRDNDFMLGGDGSDLLLWNNGDGSDFMEGGEGADTVQVNGADGADDFFSVTPNGQRVQIERTNAVPFTLDIGTTEDLDVNGQGGDDVIAGSDGLSSLISLDFDGGTGNDLIYGGDGNDVLRGGSGDDVLVGLAGIDVVLGQDGNDLMIWHSEDGSDFAEGGDGDDTLEVNGDLVQSDMFFVGANGDRVSVARSNLDIVNLDVGTTETIDVRTHAGDDEIAGGAGLNGLTSIIFNGGDGIDLLLGSDGDDTFIGGAGEDAMFGFDGQDVFIWSSGDQSDFVVGGSGLDAMIVNGSDGVDQFEFLSFQDLAIVEGVGEEAFEIEIEQTEDIVFNLGAGDDHLVLNEIGFFVALNSVKVNAGDGDDWVLAQSFNLDLIAHGGEGRDRIYSGSGNDTIVGGAGNDILLGGAGNDELDGGEGNDSLFGQDGTDVVLGGNGDDWMFGGGGDDFLDGGLGWDFVVGGLGDDEAINAEFTLTI